MALKPARPSEAPVTEWETFEGVTYGYDNDGNQVVEVSARTPISEHVLEHENNIRGWVAFDANRNSTTGTAKGLRAAKVAALAALRTSKGVS